MGWNIVYNLRRRSLESKIIIYISMDEVPRAKSGRIESIRLLSAGGLLLFATARAEDKSIRNAKVRKRGFEF